MKTENRIIDDINASNTFIPSLEIQKYMYENEYIENIKLSFLEDANNRLKFYKFLSERNFEAGQYEQTYFIKLLLEGIRQTNDIRFYFLLNELFNDDVLSYYLEDYELYIYQLFLSKPDYFVKSAYQYKAAQLVDYINQSLPEALLTNKDYFSNNLVEINLGNDMLLIDDKTVSDFQLPELKKNIINECPHIEAIFSPSFETDWEEKTIVYYNIFDYINTKFSNNLSKDVLRFYKQKYYPFFNAYVIEEKGDE